MKTCDALSGKLSKQFSQIQICNFKLKHDQRKCLFYCRICIDELITMTSFTILLSRQRIFVTWLPIRVFQNITTTKQRTIQLILRPYFTSLNRDNTLAYIMKSFVLERFALYLFIDNNNDCGCLNRKKNKITSEKEPLN